MVQFQAGHRFPWGQELIKATFDVDSQLFDLSGLTDLILSQPTIGSTVKVDGEDTDAYAFLTILNLHEHREKKVIKDLTAYLVEKSKSSQHSHHSGNLLSSPHHKLDLS
jgi:protein BCP1